MLGKISHGPTLPKQSSSVFGMRAKVLGAGGEAEGQMPQIRVNGTALFIGLPINPWINTAHFQQYMWSTFEARLSFNVEQSWSAVVISDPMNWLSPVLESKLLIR